MSGLKILFMGTPDFAEASLRALCSAGERVAGVITGEDKPKGRGMKLGFSEVKSYALSENIPVYQPHTLKDGAISGLLEEINPDVIVVVAYGKILPGYVLEYPKYGCINVHGSLLPEYRGAAPIQRAVLDGKSETGVTTMYMASGIDTGDMIYSERIKIGENETVGELWDRMSELGGKLLLKTLDGIENGTAPRIKQDEKKATYAPKIEKEECKIDFTQSAKSVHNKIRGMSPYPAAYGFLDGLAVKLYDSEEVCGGKFAQTPGSIASLTPDSVVIVCGEGAVRIKTLKPEGSKAMSVRDMINGRKITAESIFS
jgi:methionyl-tRNA formyltransferase